jgi:nicotinate-nucleotide pyrophosphorylase (carboxylating)
VSFSEEIEKTVERALAEDLAWGDITTQALVPPDLQGQGTLLVKGRGVLAGMGIAALAFRKVDPEVQLEIRVKDGERVEPGTRAGVVRGRVGSLLMAERTALNFLTRLSGIATLTARYVEAVAGTGCIIADTRKTAPGLRLLDKLAVRVGGGKNHRFHLGDGVLIKDNHWQALKLQGLPLEEGVRRAQAQAHHLLRIEVEVRSLEEAEEAVRAGADWLLLDNMAPEEMGRIAQAFKGKAHFEASGGIDLSSVRRVAETGVDMISVGALTHSSKALDISLELEH